MSAHLLHLAVAPALPLHKAGPYVAAAYVVFAAVLLLYVAIMARKLSRNQRELTDLRDELSRLRERQQLESTEDEPAHHELHSGR